MALMVMLPCIKYRDLDPLVNRWDLGADPLEFAKQRQEIVAGLWDEIADKGHTRWNGLPTRPTSIQVTTGSI